MSCIWDGDMTSISDIIFLQALLANAYKSAMQVTRPIISGYLDQWKAKWLDPRPADECSEAAKEPYLESTGGSDMYSNTDFSAKGRRYKGLKASPHISSSVAGNTEKASDSGEVKGDVGVEAKEEAKGVKDEARDEPKDEEKGAKDKVKEEAEVEASVEARAEAHVGTANEPIRYKASDIQNILEKERQIMMTQFKQVLQESLKDTNSGQYHGPRDTNSRWFPTFTTAAPQTNYSTPTPKRKPRDSKKTPSIELPLRPCPGDSSASKGRDEKATSPAPSPKPFTFGPSTFRYFEGHDFNFGLSWSKSQVPKWESRDPDSGEKSVFSFDANASTSTSVLKEEKPVPEQRGEERPNSKQREEGM